MLMGEKQASSTILHDAMAQTELKVDCQRLAGKATTSQENSKNADAKDADTHEYLTGPRLVVVISIVITVAFLLFLDSSVIVTVSGHLHIRF
jgi:hypothetical protein